MLHRIITLLVFAIITTGFISNNEVENKSDINEQQIENQSAHRIVAHVAEKHLTDEARNLIDELLDGETLTGAAIWSNNVLEFANWNQSETEGANSETQLISALEEKEAILRDQNTSKQKKADALIRLMHLVNYAHMPTNIVSNSGQDIKVVWFGKKTNLHQVWTRDIISHSQLSFSEFASYINGVSRKQITQWKQADYSEWVEESNKLKKKATDFSLAERAYRPECKKPGRRCAKGSTLVHRSTTQPVLGSTYYNEMLPIVKDRMHKAGVRLAGLLNNIFESAQV